MVVPHSRSSAVAGEFGAPGVITLTQPKIPEAKIRGAQKGFQWVILVSRGLKRSGRGCKGVLWDPCDPLS